LEALDRLLGGADDPRGGQLVHDRRAVRVQPTGSLDFVDPWGNHVQVVDYRDIQFTKTPAVLREMGVDELPKTEAAREKLRRQGVTEP
jgi:hypothetical protein